MPEGTFVAKGRSFAFNTASIADIARIQIGHSAIYSTENHNQYIGNIQANHHLSIDLTKCYKTTGLSCLKDDTAKITSLFAWAQNDKHTTQQQKYLQLAIAALLRDKKILKTTAEDIANAPTISNKLYQMNTMLDLRVRPMLKSSKAILLNLQSFTDTAEMKLLIAEQIKVTLNVSIIMDFLNLAMTQCEELSLEAIINQTKHAKFLTKINYEEERLWQITQELIGQEGVIWKTEIWQLYGHEGSTQTPTMDPLVSALRAKISHIQSDLDDLDVIVAQLKSLSSTRHSLSVERRIKLKRKLVEKQRLEILKIMTATISVFCKALKGRYEQNLQALEADEVGPSLSITAGIEPSTAATEASTSSAALLRPASPQSPSLHATTQQQPSAKARTGHRSGLRRCSIM